MADDDDLYDDLYALDPPVTDHQTAKSSSSAATLQDDFGLEADSHTMSAAANKGSSSNSSTTATTTTTTTSFIPPSSSAQAPRPSFIPAPQAKNNNNTSTTSSFIPQHNVTPPSQQQGSAQQAATGLSFASQQRPSHLPQPLGIAGGSQGSSAAVSQQSTTPSSATVAASGGSDDGQKMFVGGLSWDTTEDGLIRYFSAYGKVLECNIMKDPATGTSRGFGFLKFEDAKSVNGVMVKEHWLDGKIIDPKRAIPRDSSSKSSKIFVGGIPPHTTSESFRRTFAQFGNILDHNLMMDKETSKPRGFGFVTFETEESGRRALELDGNVLLDGKMVDIRRATSKNAPGSNNQDTAATTSSSSNRRNNQQTADQNSTPDFSTVQAALQGGGGAFNSMMTGASGMDVNTMSALFSQNGWGTGHWNPAMMQQMLMSAAAQQQSQGAGGMGGQWNPMMMGGMGMGMGGMGMMGGGMGGYGGMAGMGMDNNAWMAGGAAQGYGQGAGYGQQGFQQQRGASSPYGGMSARGGTTASHNQGGSGFHQRSHNGPSRATPTGPSGLPTQPRGTGLPNRPSVAAVGSNTSGGSGNTPTGPAGDAIAGRGRDVNGSTDAHKRERSPSRRSDAAGGGYEERPLR